MLERAALRGANLQKADLFMANLQRADLESANLQEAHDLTLEQLSTVKTLYQAKLDAPLLAQVKENYPHLLEVPKETPAQTNQSQ